MRTTEVFSVWYLHPHFCTTAVTLLLSNTIIDSAFFSQGFLEHSLLYFEVFKRELFYQIDKANTEGFFAVDFIFTATFFRS